MNPTPNKDQDPKKSPSWARTRSTRTQQQMQAGEGQQYGEGNYKATRQYNEGLKDHVEHHDIEREARDAAPRTAAEEKEMEEAERVGRSKSRARAAPRRDSPTRAEPNRGTSCPAETRVWPEPRQRVLAVEEPELLVDRGIRGREQLGRLEERLRAHGEELARRSPPRRDRAAARPARPERARRAAARPHPRARRNPRTPTRTPPSTPRAHARVQRRKTVGIAVAHVELVGELVDHDVVARDARSSSPASATSSYESTTGPPSHASPAIGSLVRCTTPASSTTSRSGANWLG